MQRLHEALDKGEVDLDELVRHDRLQGKIGALGEKRAKTLVEQQTPTLRQQIQEELRQQAEAARLANLRRTNPAAFVQELDRVEARQAQQGQQTDAALQRLQQTQAEAKDLIGAKLAALPANVRAAIVEAIPEDRSYEGSFAEGLSAYVDDVLQAALKAAREENIASEVGKRLKGERDALRKELLAELNGGGESLDISGGGQPADNDGAAIYQRYMGGTAADRKAIRSDPQLRSLLDAELRGRQQTGR